MNYTRCFLAFLFFVSGIITAQHQNGSHKRPFIPESNGFMFEVICLPSASGFDCYIAYRVEYKKLVFVKDEQVFKAKFNLSVEAADSVTGKIYRENQSQEITARNYETTNSPSEHAQGVIMLALDKGKYSIIPSVYDLNTGIEHHFRKLEADLLKPAKYIFLDPIVVKKDESDYTLANYEGAVPFSRFSYDLIIPVIDTAITSVFAELYSEDSLVVKTELKESRVSALSFSVENNSVAVSETPGFPKTRNFLLPDINRSLREGGSRLLLSFGSKPEAGRTFVKRVRWTDKPFSLMNAEYAVKMLKYIATEKEIDDLKSSSDNLLTSAIWKYWRKFDPTPATAFNELMEEYYQRVDYAMNNFSIVSSRNGAETDRGRIYIKYGKPFDVERSYNDSKEVVEIWNYSNPSRKFVFSDKTGLGNFVLNQTL